MRPYTDAFYAWLSANGIRYDNAPARTLKAFAAEVDQLAESKMLKTGKLEGSHKAAMDELLKEWGLR